MRFRGLVLVVLAAAAAAGCGRGPAAAAVSGTITVGGKPADLRLCRVVCVGSDGTPVAVSAAADGRYRVEGLAAGPVRVGLQHTPMDYLRAKRTGSGEGKPLSEYPSPVPPDYRDPQTSPLTLTADPGENTFDIDLKN